jgi:CopA family copper-resistance protein
MHHLFSDKPPSPGRRRFVLGAGALIGLGALGWHTASAASPRVYRGNDIDLTLDYLPVNLTGRPAVATAVNGSLPGPVLRWRQNDEIRVRVSNRLREMSSIHWHGIVLPAEMDGVPGLSFPGIAPGETFEYRFRLRQHGTYWYHSHSGFQEQTGLFGAIIIDPAGAPRHHADRDMVIVLSDWSDETPDAILANLRRQSDYYNANRRTAGDLWREIRTRGVAGTWRERAMWNRMRMNERDIADVSGLTYTYLMNGMPPAEGWTALFRRGEKLRLRFINAAAMTFFDVRIPGLPLRVIASDGQDIEPVTVDEFRLGVAETLDVLVEPQGDMAYTIFAQAMDRSGYALGTLTPDQALRGEVPAMDPLPMLEHVDMAMAGAVHADEESHHHQGASDDPPADDHAHHHHHHAHEMETGWQGEIVHGPRERGVHVDMRAEAPRLRLNDPGPGLRNNGRRVLTHADLRSTFPTPDPRDPEREIQLHLTGNMHRYLWSVDGIPFAEAAPLQLRLGERLRIVLVNDTMMSHPIHLHGMWSELETGDPGHLPRKHTLVVQPGAVLTHLLTADAPGAWAWHCHLLYHMSGMFRVVNVS